ncbi:MAG: fibronectin type III domain-containing protein, partial [Planctomycetes bacterium]|nr:fibronectin type III domain-containing protein [Planctomycetota bacterium]
AGTRYYYQTRAYDLAGNNSAYTSIASDWTELMNPTTPSGLTATAVLTSQINLSWTASTDSGGSGLAGYKIERSTSGLAGTFSQIATAPATTYSNTGLTASKRYYYKVRAYDNAGNNSAYTSTVNALTPAVNETTPPSTPGGLTATAMSTSQINLSWTASTDTGGSTLAGYKIERSTDGVTFSQIATTTTTTYSNIELLTGTRYYYQVRAYDLAGNNSAYTSIASDWTDVTAPPVPTGFAATAVDTTIIDVSWTAPVDQDGSGIAGYKLQRSTSSSGPFSQIVDTPATIYSDTGRTPGTTYYYKVCAYDNAGNQGLFTSAVQSTTPTSHTVSTPLVPTGVAHTITEVLRTYTVSNSVCSLGHPLKYEFEWGDGSPNSPPDPSTVRNHVFSTEGTFSVKARASCDWKLSFFSNPLSVTVQNSGIITGDDINVPVYLPFDFKYAGTSYPGGSWPLRVCTNGWVSLTSSATSGPPAGLPTTSVSDVIAGFWDDLKPTGGSNGVVSWAATPSELVITWNAAAYYRNTSAHATFAITLKSDSTIDLTYGAVDLTTYYVQGFQYGTSWGKTWATSGAPQPRTIQNFYCFSTNTPYELIYGYKTDGTSTTNPLLVDTNRIDVVFVGDGFPIGDLTLFQNKTKDTADAARLTKPIADQLSMFNFWRVLPIAPTSGTSTMEIFRDPFIWYDEGRRKITNASSVSRAGNITCVLANSTSLNRGKSEMGGNGSVLVWGGPNITRFQQLFVHEFGHALGGLGDEYISEKGFAKSYNEPRDSTTKTLAPVLTLTVTYTADSTNPPRPFIVRPRLLYDYLEYSAVWINKVTNGVRTQVAYFDNSSSSFFYKEHCGTCPAQAAGHQPHDLATPPVEFPFTPTAPNDVYEVNLWTVGMISELWVDVDHSSVCSDGSLPPNLTTCRDTTKWRSGDTDPEFGDGTLHVYSGALESPFGIWRPTRNKCLMSEHDDENDPLRYCLVCRNAISQRMTQPYPN